MNQREFVISILHKAYENQLKPNLFSDLPHKEQVSSEGKMPFVFIDLFAGIGGLRLGLEAAGGQCVFSSEWDKFSQKTYAAWYGETPFGDINKVNMSEIPDHDILSAGFPCQPFSIAGVSKKNSLGKAHGFDDPTQGTLFFQVAKIVEVKKPPILLLENVKNLKSHDKKQTWRVIKEKLEVLGYVVFDQIIDAANYVPQHRERMFIVCFDKKIFGDNPPFEYPAAIEGPRPKFKDILDPQPPEKYTLTNHLWTYLQNYAAKHKAKGNGFGFGMADLNGVTRTLSARYHKDGSEVLIPQGKKKNPRRLTPREAARLMGFPDHLPIVVSDTQAYRQFGNAVVPLVAEAVAKQIVEVMAWKMKNNGNGCLLKGKVVA
ncbi:DNA (cytosine-5-)-methyltransferase [bacterium AH-315-I18]|nr:DNA (cytosine-5-)-methyltransferase [bacterium AH-315-I18]